MTRAAEQGFTVVELMITLFIAAAFIFTGYRLYGMVMQRTNEARHLSEASNIAYKELRRHSTYDNSVSSNCAVPTKLPTSSLSALPPSLPAPAHIEVVRCQFALGSRRMMKIDATVTYGNPQRKVVHATIVSQQ